MRLNGIKTTDEILELGIEKFNEACRASVMKYTGEWREYVTRQARWVDFDNDYRTYEPDYMESVIWAFKQLYDKGLVYEGFRVLPYCWNDETPLSNHELRMDDDVYQMRQDPAVTVGFRITSDGPLRGAKLLVWTTTPWTLPSNLAVMVGADIDYVVVESTPTERALLLAEARLPAYARELGDDAHRRLARDGRRPGRPRPTSRRSPTTPATRTRSGSSGADEFVTTTDGTGLVHSAGAFGEDDKEVTDREGIEAVMPVGKDGRFTAPVDRLRGHAGLRRQPAHHRPPQGATSARRAVGRVTPGTVLLRRETYDHSYPHCWRCREPLIYKGVSSWFVEVTAFKQRMLELNQQINWVPEHNRDGSVRQVAGERPRLVDHPQPVLGLARCPVWKSDDEAYPRIDVYGSFEELERDFGRLPRNKDGEPDLHRPVRRRPGAPEPRRPDREVDDAPRPRRARRVVRLRLDVASPRCTTRSRTRSGSSTTSRRDFIVEYSARPAAGSTRCTSWPPAIFDRPAFQNCISHGIVLGSDGNKMSKSLRNYPDVREVFDRDGADAMRWFLMASPILRGGNLVVTEQGIRDAVRTVMIPLWNSWYFFQLYANAAGYEGDARRRRRRTRSTGTCWPSAGSTSSR